ncbi:MAG: lipoate--protein ligase family protein [Pedosphaera sp.]|nr:lipoate--protein ligase family protein [Pedosphaera sp.]
MKCLELTLPSPEANLACDEALIDLCESGFEDEILRFWEPKDYFVVLGYANKASEEVHLGVCREKQIPVLRRCSGGGTVVQGPGCLNYSLVLRIRDAGPLLSITQTNTFIMKAHKEAIESVVMRPVEVQGHTDLSIHQLKFSGNAQRRKRHCLIFHGTFLLDFDLSILEELLPIPSKQPSYRENRSHTDFLVNLKIAPAPVKECLKKAWNITGALDTIPWRAIDELVKKRYSRPEWNYRF